MEFPELYTRFSLIIYFIHSISSVGPNLPTHPIPSSPLGVHRVVLSIYVSISALQIDPSPNIVLSSLVMMLILT